MPLVINDEVLQTAGLSATEAAIEFACRLFDAGYLSFERAASFAGVSIADFELATSRRNIPRYRYEEDDYQNDLITLRSLGHFN
jgi:predicted HTH domain antitoxin